MTDSAEFDIVMNGVDNASDEIKAVNGELGNIGETSTKAAEGTDKASLSMTDFNSAIQVGKQAMQMLGQAYDASVGKSQAYAQTVRDLKNVSGESAENTSRFIQVLDDWQISAGDAMVATKALTKQGLAPNMETIAQLSKEYLALDSVEERNAFTTKNLGRAGLEWQNVLKQGPDALRAQAAAVSENLIMNDKMLAQAEQLRLMQDQQADAMDGLAIVVGTKLTPAVSAWTEVMVRALESEDGLKQVGGELAQLWMGNMIPLAKDIGTIMNRNAAETDKLTEAQRENVKSVEEMNTANSELLSLTASLQSQTDSYEQTMRSLKEQQDEVAEKMVKAKGGDELNALSEQYVKLSDKMREAGEANEAATAKIVAGNLLAKLSVDGLTDAEFEQYQQIQVGLGLIDQKTADQAVKMNALTTQLANGEISSAQFTDAVKNGTMTATGAMRNYATTTAGQIDPLIAKTNSYIATLNAIPKAINTTITQNGTPPPAAPTTTKTTTTRTRTSAQEDSPLGGIHVNIVNAYFEAGNDFNDQVGAMII